MPRTTKKTVTKSVTQKTPKAYMNKTATDTAPAMNEVPTCTHCCHCSRRKKLFVIICAFVAGFLVSELFHCGTNYGNMPHMRFKKGCVDMASVTKNPRMLQQVLILDANHDGCVTRAEVRAAKHTLRDYNRKKAKSFRVPSTQEDEGAKPMVNVQGSIAPVMD